MLFLHGTIGKIKGFVVRIIGSIFSRGFAPSVDALSAVYTRGSAKTISCTKAGHVAALINSLEGVFPSSGQELEHR